jgi:hypothetical protein
MVALSREAYTAYQMGKFCLTCREFGHDQKRHSVAEQRFHARFPLIREVKWHTPQFLTMQIGWEQTDYSAPDPMNAPDIYQQTGFVYQYPSPTPLLPESDQGYALKVCTKFAVLQIEGQYALHGQWTLHLHPNRYLELDSPERDIPIR